MPNTAHSAFTHFALTFMIHLRYPIAMIISLYLMFFKWLDAVNGQSVPTRPG